MSLYANTLFTYILYNNGLDAFPCIPAKKSKKSLATSAGMRKYWRNMKKSKRKAICKKMSVSAQQHWDGLTEKEKEIKLAKSGLLGTLTSRENSAKRIKYWENLSEKELTELRLALSIGTKRTWKKMSVAKRKKFGAASSKLVLAYYKSRTKEQNLAGIKNYHKVIHRTLRDAWEHNDTTHPTVAALKKHQSTHTIVIKNLPRVNDYCGHITSADLKLL